MEMKPFGWVFVPKMQNMTTIVVEEKPTIAKRITEKIGAAGLQNQPTSKDGRRNGMADREKTITYLKAYVNCYANRHKICNRNCVLYGHRDCAKYANEAINDALELLKEQEAVKPTPGMLCGQCGCRIYQDANYCYNCGRKVEWDAHD